MRRFWLPFWSAARRSLWGTLAELGLAVFSLLGGTASAVVGLASWAVFIVMFAGLVVASVAVYHIASLAWVAQADNLKRLEEELGNAREQKPRLELGAPVLLSNEFLQRTQLTSPTETGVGPSGPQHRVQAERRPIRKYQIPVTNAGAYAEKVTVKLAEISPDVGGVSREVTLHIGDDDPPLDNYRFESSFSLAKGETRYVDVVAVDIQDPKACYLWNIASPDAVQEVKLGGTHTFIIRAYAGHVCAEQRYKVYGDSLEARLEMSLL